MSLSRTDIDRVAFGARHDDRIKFAVISASASGATAVVAAVAGKHIRVLHYQIVVAGNVAVKFQSDSTDITGLMSHSAEGEGSNPSFFAGLFQTAEGEALNINLDAAIQVGGHVTYVEYKED